MFQRPEAFLLLLAFFLIIWLKSKIKNPAGFPNLTGLKEKVPTASWTKRNLVSLVGYIAFSLFAIALADPTYSVQRSRRVEETRLIVLIEDLSGSMESPIDSDEYSYTSSKPKKYEVALDAAKSFIDLRPTDYMALIAYADYAQLACPFTNDRSIVKQKLDDIRIGTEYHKEMKLGGSTNAPEAIWLGITLFINSLPKKDRPSLSELMDMRASLNGPNDQEGELYIPPLLRGKNFGRGKVMIFFSDGDFYTGPQGLSVVRAIRLMRYLGIKGYFLLTNKNIDQSIEQAITLADHNNLATAGLILNLKEDLSNTKAVYSLISGLEKIKIIFEGFEEKKSSSGLFMLLGVIFLLGHMFLKYDRRFRRPEL